MKNNKGQKTGGILQGMQKHRFRVLVNDDVDLCQMVVNCSLNCHKREFELVLRQSITADIMERINNICIGIGTSTINVAATNNQEDADHFSYTMTGAKVVDHKFDLHYASGDVAVHRLNFTYRMLTVK
ncbi:MAG: hypothetical protein V3W20_06505 [Candidatus Neomarinimicrobiota bacterium]